jgi:arylamine N-acetyltransferase
LTKISGATSILLDLYSIRPGPSDVALLERVSCNFAALPWENLTKFLKKHEQCRTGLGKLRRTREVMADHAALGSGGTCFSLTNALRRIMTDLGYHAYPVMADMKHGSNIHCALLVENDDRKFLLDPGYLVPEPVPLPREREVRIRLPGRTLSYRPTEGGEIELHTTNDRGESVLRYRLRPSPIPDDEFCRFWLRSFDATGMNSLYLNKITTAGRISAHNLNLRIDDGTGKTNLKLQGRYVEGISDRFGIGSDLVRKAFEEWEKRRCHK